MKIIVSFSGGKDSQACLIQAAKQYGADKIEAVFCDTGWEHPDTYQHITDVCKQMGVRITTLKPEFNFIEICKKYRRFPEEYVRQKVINVHLWKKSACILNHTLLPMKKGNSPHIEKKM